MSTVPEIDCPRCGGSGRLITQVPDCCGRIAELGYCRGDCCVPRDEEYPCEWCGGGGKVPAAPVTANKG